MAKRASATVVDRPKAASWSAALRHSCSAGTERQQRHGRAFAQDAALADLERDAFGRQRHAEAFAARITEGGGAVVDGGRRRDHVHELGLVRRRHDDEARQADEIGDVEGAGVRRAVGADETGAVDGKAHRQPLDGDVVHDLIVGALQERRIDGGERLQALGRQTGGERDGVLLGDADIEGALGELLAEEIEAGAVGHGRGDGDDLVVLLRLGDQASANTRV